MRLLLDQNISFRIVKLLQVIFPDCKNVSQIGLYIKEDLYIWTFSRNQSFVIVTFDSDFYDLRLIAESPPKIIWISNISF